MPAHSSPLSSNLAGREPSEAPESSLDIARGIVGADSALRSHISALPGSLAGQDRLLSSDSRPNGEAEGLDLPSRQSLDLLLDTYVKPVHWFMLLFHERSFRKRYENLLVNGIRCKRDTKFRQLATGGSCIRLPIRRQGCRTGYGLRCVEISSGPH